jgi:hypothetical protein
MKRIFMMELDDQEDLDTVIDDLGISLHTLTGILGTNTMQLLLSIASTTLQALVDYGPMHSFIHDVVVHRLGMEITYRPGLSVKVANRERMQSYGVCKGTMLSIQGETFHGDCYTLPLEGFDLNLSIQWLKSLGLIVWDFTALSMVFLHDSQSMRFIGYGGQAPGLCSIQPQDDLLKTLLTTYADIFEEPQSLPPQRHNDHHIHLLPAPHQWQSSHIDTHSC